MNIRNRSETASRQDGGASLEPETPKNENMRINTMPALPPRSHTGDQGSRAQETSLIARVKRPTKPVVAGSSRRKGPENRPIPGAPGWSTKLTPAMLIGAALTLKRDEIYSFLYKQLRNYGWTERALRVINHLGSEDLWITGCQRVQSNLSEFTYKGWEQLELASRGASCFFRKSCQEELQVITEAAECWSSPVDQRRVKFHLLGKIWQRIEPGESVVDTLSGWFADFGSQPDSEREVIRRLWHTPREQALYDELPEEIVIHRGGGLATMMEGFSFTLDYHTAEKKAGIGSFNSDDDHEAPDQPYIISLRVLKSTIVGIKYNCPKHCIEVVAAPPVFGKRVEII